MDGKTDFNLNLYSLQEDRNRLAARLCASKKRVGMRKMKTHEIRQKVKTRYGKFAETGGKPEAC